MFGCISMVLVTTCGALEQKPQRTNRLLLSSYYQPPWNNSPSETYHGTFHLFLFIPYAHYFPLSPPDTYPRYPGSGFYSHIVLLDCIREGNWEWKQLDPSEMNVIGSLGQTYKPTSSLSKLHEVLWCLQIRRQVCFFCPSPARVALFTSYIPFMRQTKEGKSNYPVFSEDLLFRDWGDAESRQLWVRGRDTASQPQSSFNNSA